MVFGTMVDIALISLALTIVSQALQYKFAHRDEMKEHQEKIKGHQKKMNELMKRDDEKAKNELEAVQNEMMEEMNKMMSKSTKVMMFSLVVFLPALLVLTQFYSKDVINLPIGIPWFGHAFSIGNPGTWFEVYHQTNWYGWYFLSYLVMTIIIGQVMNITKIGAKKGVVANG